MIWFQFYKLKVKDGVFYYRPIFGRSRTFTLDDITSLSCTMDRKGLRSITIYSNKNVKRKVVNLWNFITIETGTGEIVSVNSAQSGYELLFQLLQEEEILESNPEFNADIPVLNNKKSEKIDK